MRFRIVAAIVACVSVMGLVAPTGAAATPRVAQQADAAAGWLARQMVDGDHVEVDFGGVSYPDAGLTVDGVFAFASTRSANTGGAAAATWLAANLTGYIGDGTTEAYAGATAKASLAAQVRGLDPANFGGVDLPARLRGLLTASGRFSDRSEFGDFSNEALTRVRPRLDALALGERLSARAVEVPGLASKKSIQGLPCRPACMAAAIRAW